MTQNCITETYVAVKECKVPNNWSSAVQQKYKQNAILKELHRSHKISSNFKFEKQRVKKKYFSVNLDFSFIQSTFNSYQKICESFSKRKILLCYNLGSKDHEVII